MLVATGDNKLATSAYVTLAIKANGELWSWGYGNYGVTGQNNETKYSSPVQVPGTDWNYGASGYGEASFFIQKVTP